MIERFVRSHRGGLGSCRRSAIQVCATFWATKSRPLPFPSFPSERRYLSRHWLSSLVLAFVLLMKSPDSYAYIDPNTGGWLFQLLFPVLVAIGIAWNFIKAKVRTFLGWIFKRSE